MTSSKIIYNEIKGKLEFEFTTKESEILAFIILKDTLDLTVEDILCNELVKINNFAQKKIYTIIQRLYAGEPIEYILNYCYFYNRKFYVDNRVLIPRPETEELVRAIIDENTDQKDLKILDIGTGSGCIAVTLKLEILNSTLYALDISKDALNVASMNSRVHKSEIKFLNVDILKTFDQDLPNVNIIVSNPPYVTERDKIFQKDKVIYYEPHIALYPSEFIKGKNRDPLIFYKKIAKLGTKILNSNGKIYFEINENFGSCITNILKNYGYSNIRIKKDINNKNRIAIAYFNYL